MVHTVALSRARRDGGPLPPAPVGQLLSRMPSLLRHCISMAYQRPGSIRGRPPRWLKAASDVRLMGVTCDDDACVVFDAPELGDAAYEVYQQPELIPTRPDPRDSGFDVFGDVLADIVARNTSSERFDTSVLRAVAGLSDVFDGVFDRMVIASRRYPSTQPVVVTRAAVDAAGDLRAMTPHNTRVRLVGELDAIRFSTQTFALKLDDGHEVKGVFQSDEFDRVIDLVRPPRRVLVTGQAIHKPSGQLLLVDADDIRAGAEEPPIWSCLPQDAAGPLALAGRRLRQRRGAGIAAVVGQWPGDETDEEIEEALEALR